MFLTKLACYNYRNIAECDLIFSEKFNCFLGSNGVGKTNLLDAIYYLSFTKSHLNAIDSHLIQHEADYFMLRGLYSFAGEEEQISAVVKRGVKKQFKRGDKAYMRMSDHIGVIPAVLISPSDQDLIAEGSGERRRFLDTVISQYDKTYLHSLMRYNQALMSRNALFKSETMPDGDILEIYEQQMAVEAQYIYEKRKNFVDGFVPVFKTYYNAIAGETEQVELNYISHSEKGDLAPLQAECRSRDFAVGYTTRGSHKDDLVMLLDGYPIKRTGSQGQNKTYLIALKLAQYIYLKQHKGLMPLLLLDDIFDKLDAERVERIVSITSAEEFGQIFITDTNRNHTEQLMQHIPSQTKIFTVKSGEITQE